MVAMRLAAGIFAIARQLEYKLLVGSAGTQDGQVNLLIRIGFQPLPTLAPKLPRVKLCVPYIQCDMFVDEAQTGQYIGA